MASGALDRHLKGRCGRAMPPSSVEENKLDTFHSQGILAPQGPKNATGVLKRVKFVSK